MLTVVMFVAALSGQQLLVAPRGVNSEQMLLVDVRGAEAFQQAHIPGALHLDVDTLSETRDNVRGLLKPVEEVRAMVAAAGVDPNRHVVVYGAAEEVKQATRMFWILEYLSYPRVSLLDGGYEAWAALGKAPATGPAHAKSIPVEDLPAEVRPELIASAADLKEGASAIVDLRAPEEYAGESKKDFVPKAGHIPGAVNVPASEALEQHRFRSQAAIADLLEQQGLTDDTPAIMYCNTGRDATVGYFMSRLLGRDDVAVYDGSIAEWAQREDLETSKQ